MQRSLLKDYWASLQMPGFWIYATWLELVSKYRRSRLGLLWALLPPALYTFGIGWFYAHLGGANFKIMVPHLGIGYLIFRLVTISLNDATTAFSVHSSFILDGRGQLTDYLLRVFSRSMFYFVIALPVAFAALLFGESWHGVSSLLLSLLGFVVMLLNIAWMMALVGILGVRFPDISQLVGSVLMLSFLFTPILWFAQDMPIGTLRGTVARLNPLFHMMESVRAPLMGVGVEPLTWYYLGALTVVGWLFAMFVYRRYARYVAIWI